MARTIGDFVWIGTMEEFTSLSSYDDKVQFTAVGYTISDSADGTFNTEYTFSEQ